MGNLGNRKAARNSADGPVTHQFGWIRGDLEMATTLAETVAALECIKESNLLFLAKRHVGSWISNLPSPQTEQSISRIFWNLSTLLAQIMINRSGKNYLTRRIQHARLENQSPKFLEAKLCKL